MLLDICKPTIKASWSSLNITIFCTRNLTNCLLKNQWESSSCHHWIWIVSYNILNLIPSIFLLTFYSVSWFYALIKHYALSPGKHF